MGASLARDTWDHWISPHGRDFLVKMHKEKRDYGGTPKCGTCRMCPDLRGENNMHWGKTNCPEYKRCPDFRESMFRGSTVCLRSWLRGFPVIAHYTYSYYPPACPGGPCGPTGPVGPGGPFSPCGPTSPPPPLPPLTMTLVTWPQPRLRSVLEKISMVDVLEWL